MKWKKWQDQLALILIILIMGLWVGDKYLPTPISEQVIGATILAFGMIITFFFRKAAPNEPPTP